MSRHIRDTATFPVEPKPCRWRFATGAGILGLLACLVLCACTASFVPAARADGHDL